MDIPRGIRNNNFGNIEDGEFAQSQPGYLGSDGRFARFEKPEHGMAAIDNLLQGYSRKGLNSVGSIINRWAPPGENNTGSYAGTVAKNMGVGVDDQLDMSDPSVRQKIAGHIANYENGPTAMAYATQNGGPPMQQQMQPPQQPFVGPQQDGAMSSANVAGPGAMFAQMADQSDAGTTMQKMGAWLQSITNPSALSALPGLEHKKQFMQGPDGSIMAIDPRTGQVATVSQGHLKPEFKPLKGVFGEENPGVFDGNTGTWHPISTSGNAVGGAAGPSTDHAAKLQTLETMRANGATKDEMLKVIPPEFRAGVQALESGNALPASFGRANGRAALMTYAHALNPDMNDNEIAARRNFMIDMDKGTLGTKIMSANKVTNHLASYYDSIDPLKNGDVPEWNAVTNAARLRSHDPDFQAAMGNHRTYKEAVASELPTMLRGSNSAESDVKSWRSNTDENAAPATSKATARSLIHVMQGQLEPIADQQNKVMKTNITWKDLLSPQSREIMDRLSKDEVSAPSTVSKAAANRPPLSAIFK